MGSTYPLGVRSAWAETSTPSTLIVADSAWSAERRTMRRGVVPLTVAPGAGETESTTGRSA